MRCTLAGAVLLLISTCALGDSAGRDVRTFPVRELTKLTLDGIANVQLTHTPGGSFVRVAGPMHAVAGVTVTAEEGALSVHGALPVLDIHVNAPRLSTVSIVSAIKAPVSSARVCRLMLSGAARARLGSIVSDVVEIYLDGAARLQVDKLTASALVTYSAGGASVELSPHRRRTLPVASRVVRRARSGSVSREAVLAADTR